MVSEELPIYKDTYDLVHLFLNYTGTFPKRFKYTLGERLVTKSLDLFTCIQKANRFKENRAKHLEDFLVNFADVKTIVRFCNELRIFSIAQEAETSRLMVIIEKQAISWKKTKIR